MYPLGLFAAILALFEFESTKLGVKMLERYIGATLQAVFSSTDLVNSRIIAHVIRASALDSSMWQRSIHTFVTINPHVVYLKIVYII